MRLLADTHIFVWCDQQPKAVPPVLMTALRNTQNQVFVSVASIWEIAIKRATGKLRFPAGIEAAIERMGFDLLPISAAHAEFAGGLPRHHNDPFDRMLIAQAMLEDLTFGTRDRRISAYTVATLGLRKERR